MADFHDSLDQALERTVDSDAGWTTLPDPDQPGRCPSIDPHDTLQCGRSIHEDDRCRFGGIAWKKGTPRYVSDRERAERLEGLERGVRALAEDLRRRTTDHLVERYGVPYYSGPWVAGELEKLLKGGA